MDCFIVVYIGTLALPLLLYFLFFSYPVDRGDEMNSLIGEK